MIMKAIAERATTLFGKPQPSSQIKIAVPAAALASRDRYQRFMKSNTALVHDDLAQSAPSDLVERLRRAGAI